MEEKFRQFLKTLKRTNDGSIPLLTLPKIDLAPKRGFVRAWKRELSSSTFRRFAMSLFLFIFISSGFMQPIPARAAACAEGDNVTISISCEWATGTHVYTGTLTIDPGVTVTADNNGGAGVEIIVDNLTLNGTITAVGEGAAGATGTGVGESANAGGGGAYGGDGGGGNAGASNAEGGMGYGSPFAPFENGSGGGDDTDSVGVQAGAGGGIIKIFLTNNGTISLGNTAVISASGTNASSVDAGGGSGGSIWIDATLGTISGPASGRATISSNGGAAVTAEAGGGGSGGRIALYYTSLSNPGNLAINAFGGNGGTQASAQGQRGGAGSVYLKAAAATNGDLVIDNGNYASSYLRPATTTQSASTTQTFDSVSIRNNAFYVVPSGYTLSATGTLSGGSAANRQPSLTAYGDLGFPSSSYTLDGLDIVQYANAATLTGLTVRNAEYTVSASGSTFTAGAGNRLGSLTLSTNGRATVLTTGTLFLNTLTVDSGALLTHGTNTSDHVHHLHVSATTSITVNSSGSIDVSQKGYTGGATGQRGNGPGGGGTGGFASGAGYGGEGGHDLGADGNPYGSVTQPVDLGSGGGNDAEGGEPGDGGGMVRLSVNTGGTIAISGSVLANGGIPTTTTTDHGGGSGGSIWIDAAGSTISGSGSVTANGGNANATQGGGGGSGGRISVQYATDSSSWTFNAAGGSSGSQSTSTVKDGGAGTIFRKADAATNGDLTVDDNNRTAANETTQVGTGTQTYDNVVIREGAKYRLDAGDTLTAVTTLTGGGTRNPHLHIFGGTLNTPTSSFTFDGFDVYQDSTIGVLTDMTVRNGYYEYSASTTQFTAGAGNRLGSLTLNSASRFVVSTTDKLFLNALTVNSGGFLTHATNTNFEAHKLDVSATTSITVNSGGSIDVDGMGHVSGTGPGVGVQGVNEGAGGGYGGEGGNGNNSGREGGISYGDPKTSFLLGSGGANANDGDVGGDGGGAIRLVAPSVTINSGGTVSADGSAAAALQDAGGGSGGTVYIDAATTLAGTGTITANGGAAASTDNGGGGGGGRIIIYHGGSLPNLTRQALGGARGAATPNTSFPQKNGGAGTIFIKASAATNGDLYVINNYTTFLDDTTQSGSASQTYDNVQVKSGSQYVIPSGSTLSAATTLVGGGTKNGKITIGGTLNLPSASTTLDGLDIDDNAAIGTVTALTVRNGYFEMSASNTQFTAGAGNRLVSLTLNSGSIFSVETTDKLYLDTLTINSGGVLTHATNTNAEAHKLDISATTSVTVASGGSIDISGKGYAAGIGPGNTNSNGIPSNTAGGGAGYGGKGGGFTSASAGQGGNTYGSVTQPLLIGSGGGNSTGAGGAGGGALRIVAPTVSLTGTVSANGSNAGGTSGGGGSGGAILIDTTTLSGSGAISANGGTDNTNGGGGGGGRIAVYYDTNSGTSAMTAYGSTGNGGFSPNDGGAGTVFVDDKNDALPNGDLIVDNNNLASAANTIQTCAPGCAQTYDNITIRNAAEYELEDGKSLTLASGGTLTGGGSSQSSIIIDNGGAFTPSGATSFNVNDIDVSNSGSFGAVTSLTVTAATFTQSGTGTFPATLTAMTLNSSATFTNNATGHGLALTTLQMNSGTYNSNVPVHGLNLTTLNIGNGSTFNNSNDSYYPFGPSFADLNVYGTLNHGSIRTLYVDHLTVQNGGTMTHTVHTSGTKTYQLDISATTSVYVYSGGTIQANAKGAPGGTGSGILTTNGVSGSICGGGGSYGALGGRGCNANASFGNGGQIYGSVTNPTDIGSGGGNSTGTGGTGGGAIRIAAPTATISGTVSANGGAAPGASGGGGSGGSVLIDVTALAGGGAITSNGGNDSINGGGGSGGRIAIKYQTNSGTSTPTAYGAGNGNGLAAGPDRGGAGTIFVDDTDDGLVNGTLIIDNNNLIDDASTNQAAASSQTYDAVIIRNDATYAIPTGTTLALASGGTLSNTGGAGRGTLTVDAGGTFDTGDATKSVTGVNVNLNGTFSTVTSLTLNGGSIFTNAGTFSAGLNALTLGFTSNFIHTLTSQLFTGSTLTVQNGGIFTQSTSSTLNITTVTVESGGTITSSDNSTTHAYGVNISATTFTVQPGGLITTDGLGFDSTTGDGQGGDGTAGGGGGHGGVGGIGRVSSIAQGVGGVTYSATTTPDKLGSGGGDDTSLGNQQGGSGGGSIILTVTGTLTMNGDISADGSNGVSNEGGGGSGGSIWLTLGTWTGSGTSTMTVNGGSGAGNDTSGGGCGAGGRIYITYASKTYTGSTPTANAGTGCTGIRAGQNGSYLEEVSGAPPVNRFTRLLPTVLEVGQNIVVSASATDDTGVASIKIYLDGTNPGNLVKTCSFSPVQTPASCQYEAGSLSAGAHSVTVVSEDGNALTDTDTTNFSVAAHASANRFELSTYKKGATSTFNLSFTQSTTSTGTLTVTFPSQFTVLSAPTSGSCATGSMGSFGFTATTLTASLTGCVGAVTLAGATVTNPSVAGQYTIVFTDDNGSGVVTIVDDDLFNISASVDPILTFNVGTQTAACDGTFSGNGGTLALGSLTTSAVATSDVSSVPHICVRLSTNAPGGAVVTVLSQNAALKSIASPSDTIPSSSATLVAGTTGYGLCVGDGGSDTGKDTTTPVGASPVRAGPFGGSCSTSTHQVGGLTTSPQTVWSVNDPTQNAFARLFIKAAVGTGVVTRNDYTDVLTFIATATY